MNARHTLSLCLLALTGSVCLPAPGSSQQATFVYRLGRDTISVETYNRTGNRIVGETVSRGAAAVTRFQYEVTLGNDGRPVSAIYRQRTQAGTPVPNAPSEIRVTFMGDSVRREGVFADSTSTRVLQAPRAIPFQGPAYGLLEIAFGQMRRGNLPTATFGTVGAAGANAGTLTLTAAGGDTIKASDGRVFRADREGRLLALDASATTQKLLADRSNARVDISALAAGMSSTGPLSLRGNASASFNQSVVFINYGRPQVRERTVWGGTLVPYNEVWRNGANEATHLATSRELTFGNVVVPPGLYTLWILNDRNAGPQLLINKQIGQWGAAIPMTNVYNPANDVGRVPMTFAPTPAHVEEYTIAIRSLGPGRGGAIDFAWGDKVATATFTVR
jgi:hypothetical protein